MNRDTAIGPPGRLDKAQNEFYAGGPGTALQQLLAPTSHGLSLATIASPVPTAVSGGHSATSGDDETSPIARFR
jgi:hypothetical protein